MKHATDADIPRLVEMLRSFHDYAELPWSYDEVATVKAIKNMMHAGCVIISDGGAIGGIIGPAWCNPKWTYACELFWWAEDGSGVKLLRAFEKWAREAGVNEVRVASMSINPRAARILDRMGYAPIETTHGKVF